MQIDSGAVASFSSFDPNRIQPSVPARQQVTSQQPGAAETAQESREAARQVAVGVAEINTQQPTIDTYVNASSDSSSDDRGAGVTAADIRDAQQAATQRQVTIEVLDRAQNGELGNPSVNPLGQLIDTTV